ncbi:hypothetical protein V5799_005494 [Amblyomma americanum]|uniref:Transmembrane protein n=1 Tax=Amblyomma americanum TaxID=6943 RepID=A0AAQ4DZ32_AMBAM
MPWFKLPFKDGKSARPSRKASVPKASSGAKSARSSRRASLVKTSAGSKSPAAAAGVSAAHQRLQPLQAAPAPKPASPQLYWSEKTSELDFGRTSLQPFVSVYVCTLFLVTLLVFVWIITASEQAVHNDTTSAERHVAHRVDVGQPPTALPSSRAARRGPPEAYTQITLDFPEVNITTYDD